MDFSIHSGLVFQQVKIYTSWGILRFLDYIWINETLIPAMNKIYFVITCSFLLVTSCVKAQQEEVRNFQFTYCKVFGDTIDFSYLEQGAQLNLNNKNLIIKSFISTLAYKNAEGESTYMEFPVNGNILSCDVLEALKKSPKKIQTVKLEALKVIEDGKVRSYPGYEFYVRLVND